VPGFARSRQRFALLSQAHAARNGGNDDNDKFSLPTGAGLLEDTLEVRASRFISHAEFGLGGPQCFSCGKMKCQSGLGWCQTKVTPQQINVLVHDKARDERLLQQVTDWLQVNSRERCPKWTIKILK